MNTTCVVLISYVVSQLCPVNFIDLSPFVLVVFIQKLGEKIINYARGNLIAFQYSLQCMKMSNQIGFIVNVF